MIGTFWSDVIVLVSAVGFLGKTSHLGRQNLRLYGKNKGKKEEKHSLFNRKLTICHEKLTRTNASLQKAHILSASLAVRPSRKRAKQLEI